MPNNEILQPESKDAPPRDYDFGIVFALAIEAGGLVDLLRDASVTRGAGFTVRQGQCHSRYVAIVESGAGAENAARATQALIDAHRPRRVFSAGFAGGLDPDLRRGDLLVADSLVDAEGRVWTTDPATLPPWLSAVRRLRVGRLLTLDRIVFEPEEKRSLGRQHQALAVDMESLVVAEICRQRNVPFMAVRVVSDAADDALPCDVEKLLVQRSTAGRLGTALGSIWRRPSSLMDMLALQQNAVAASDRLAKFLAGAIKHIE